LARIFEGGEFGFGEAGGFGGIGRRNVAHGAGFSNHITSMIFKVHVGAR
jgi:hypothetical protein